MTACWCRLIQPENSRRKKVSGGGPSQELASAARDVQPWARLAKLHGTASTEQCRLRSGLSRVFAQHGVQALLWLAWQKLLTVYGHGACAGWLEGRERVAGTRDEL